MMECSSDIMAKNAKKCCIFESFEHGRSRYWHVGLMKCISNVLALLLDVLAPLVKLIALALASLVGM